MRKKKEGATGKGANIRQADEESELEKPTIGEDSTLNRVDSDNFDLDTIIKKRIAEAISGVTSKVSSVSTRVSTLEKSRAKVSAVTSVSQRVSSLEANKHVCQSNENDITIPGGDTSEKNLVIQFPRAFKNTPAVAYAVVKAMVKSSYATAIPFDADMRATTKSSFTVGLANYAKV